MVKTMNKKDLLKLILNLMDNYEDSTNKGKNTESEDEISSIDNFLLSEYVIVRTYSAGVFAGTLQKRSGAEVILTNARRIWEWEGAASLSQLAEEGSSKPQNCKFPCEVKKVLLLGVIEILKVTKLAEENIKSVPIWRK